jgi:flagellar basal body-associated protein FliL
VNILNEKMSKIILIVMIAILVLLVGIGAAVGIYFLNSGGDSKKTTEVTPADITSTVAVSAGDAITCNIIADGSDSTKLVRFSVTLYIKDSDTEFKTLLTDRQAEVRSEIEKIAKSKTSKELNSINAEDVLGNEIKKKLNKLYKPNQIVKVACYDLITQ